MFEKKRCHFTYIFELFVRYIYALIIIIISIGVNSIDDIVRNFDDIKELGGFVGSMSQNAFIVLIFAGITLAAVLLLMIFCVFKWHYTVVYAEDNTLIYQTGRFLKKRTAIPFDKINTIDMGRNLFEKLVGTCKLKVDTGAYATSQEKKGAEVNLVFSLAEAEEIRKYILHRAGRDDDAEAVANGKETVAAYEPKWAVKASFGDFMLYGITSSGIMKVFWIGLFGFAVGIMGSLAELAGPYAETVISFLSHFNIIMMVLMALGLIFVTSLVSSIFNVLWAAVRFYGFRVAREGRNIIVRYGLITDKNYTLQVRNIHAVKVSQNITQQLLGRCSVEVVCMGFGDENNETSLLFPIIKLSKLNELLGVVLPEYVTEMQTHKKKRSGFIFHAFSPIFWTLVVAVPTCWICSMFMKSVMWVVVLFALFGLLLFVNGVMSYRHADLDWNEKVVSVQSGGLNKTVYRIRTDAVQEVQVFAGMIKRPLGLGTYNVHFHGPMARNTAVVGTISSEFFDELAKAVED